ncbi:DUF202 domain-containing protein [Amycolatopsis acidicola]|uniref:DUF202 domain-containing protein n=1 Tax=Amycolatopsis acidicola TaxID=2596893 RepID=A0A5N0V1G3_9PSEU|nr:DUF202 domain-containing protein [Amycolatopsis acidicola]KAA9159749.1 DUF202 domain-containing protein [Amycolatopsis acidicola]
MKAAPGLQPERTALAWQRTSLSAAVLAVLLLRSGIVDRAPLTIAAGVFAAALVPLSGFAARSVPTTGASRRRLMLATAAAAASGLLAVIGLLVG